MYGFPFECKGRTFHAVPKVCFGDINNHQIRSEFLTYRIPILLIMSESRVGPPHIVDVLWKAFRPSSAFNSSSRKSGHDRFATLLAVSSCPITTMRYSPVRLAKSYSLSQNK